MTIAAIVPSWQASRRAGGQAGRQARWLAGQGTSLSAHPPEDALPFPFHLTKERILIQGTDRRLRQQGTSQAVDRPIPHVNGPQMQRDFVAGPCPVLVLW